MKFINKGAVECFMDVMYADVRYALISIQGPPEGDNYLYLPGKSCADVLTLFFDDIDQELPKGVLFSVDDARRVIDFVEKNIGHVDEFWIHCLVGISRSAGMAAALSKIYNNEDSEYFKKHIPNRHVYRTILNEWEKNNPLQ